MSNTRIALYGLSAVASLGASSLAQASVIHFGDIQGPQANFTVTMPNGGAYTFSHATVSYNYGSSYGTRHEESLSATNGALFTASGALAADTPIGELFGWTSSALLAGNNAGANQVGYAYGCGRSTCYGTRWDGFSYNYGSWSGVTGYLGLAFDDADGRHYGWAQISVTRDSVDLLSWAYESVAGVGIMAGSLISLAPPPVQDPTPAPAPASLALFALGGAGLLGWRKRRA